MAFTYTKGDTADRNRLRLEIGDTDINRSLFDDDELDDILVQEPGVIPSAARACEILAVRFARDFDFSADGSSFSKSKLSEQYTKMGRRLRARARGTSIIVPRRIDGFSDDVDSDEVNVRNTTSFDRGRFDT